HVTAARDGAGHGLDRDRLPCGGDHDLPGHRLDVAAAGHSGADPTGGGADVRATGGALDEDHARGGLDADGACGAALGDAAGDGARGDVCPAGQGNHYADTALTYSGDAPAARGAAVGRAADVRHGVPVPGDGQSTSTAATADVDVPAGDDVAVAVDDVGARAVSGLDSVDVPAGDHA